ncbi:MAG: efflux RND transporter periplasmic adaptor subunit [Holosporaceae bacterium]|nr:efflux RND transporter periplasmic adaptor subunit [Holosporaceae bacterium]
MRDVSVFAVLIVSLLAVGCDNKKQMQTPLPLVGATKAVKRNVPLVLEVPAKITGSLEIQIRAQVSGILKSRLFKEGQYVKEGEKLFEIDQEPYKAALTKAQGTFAQAQSELRRTTRDHERMKRLYRDKAVSQKEHDDALSAFERAEANLKVAQGSLHEAEINLGYTEVKAPISGIVRKEEQSIGNLVSSNGQPSLLTTMVQICPLHANFSVSGALWSSIAKSHNAGKIKLRKFDDFKVEIIMSDDSVYPKTGKIIFVDSSEDDLTSGVSIKAEVPNDENQKFLLPGQFVRIKLVGAEYKDVVVVPQSALISTKMGSIVYVVKEDKIVEVRPVKAELVENQAIIHSGLKEGEIVISEGIVKARPGQLVNALVK